MKYISTRGAPPVDFTTAMLSGLAPDGGLYVPEKWPRFTKDQFLSWRSLSYDALAFEIMKPFVEGSIDNAVLKKLIKRAYSSFHHEERTPLYRLSDQLHVLELFHGPTLAFKDVALQMLGQIFDHVLAERNEYAAMVGATSGDTGSAAIEAVRNSSHCRIFMLHPENRISEVQRRQMTSVLEENVYNIALKGNFDDCQAIVKKLFNDRPFVEGLAKRGQRISAVNSINWARIMAQIVYYVYAALKLGAPEKKLRFVVPTGNFGNAFAAYAAKQMNLPIGDLVTATNANDIVTRFFETGTLERRTAIPTISNAMDIQISNNLERFLFDLIGRDTEKLRAIMQEFMEKGSVTLPPEQHQRARQSFSALRADDDETLAMIREVYQKYDYISDPHTAVGIHAAENLKTGKDVITVCLACAAPAKFPKAVEKAITVSPPLPEFLDDLYERPEKYYALENDVADIRDFILSHAKE